jgi:hypothetical protein
MSHDEEQFGPVSEPDMARVLGLTVLRGTQIRRRHLAVRASLVALVICVVAIPLSLSINRQPGQNSGTTLALRITSAGPFQDVVWKQVEYPGINFAKVSYPGNFGCNSASRFGFRPEVQQVTYVRPAHGTTRIALVLARCDNGSNAPSSLYAFTVKAVSTRPHLEQTLLAAPASGSATIWYATGFSISQGSVVLPLRGVTGSAALCCPNVMQTLHWKLVGEHFVGGRTPVREIPPTCLSSGLAATPGRFGVATGHVEVTISLKNTSSSTCSLSGNPSAQMLDSSGQPIATEETTTEPALTSVIVSLAPGSVASFTLGYPDATGYSGASCPSSAKVLFIYNGERENTFTLPLHLQPYGGPTVAQLQCGQITVSPIIQGSGT